MDLTNLTWTCHACGDERPDALISVVRADTTVNLGVRVEFTQRFCNDRLACKIKAQKKVDTMLNNFMWDD